LRLRGLLPDENFEDARLSSLSLSPDHGTDAAIKREGKSASGVRVKSEWSLQGNNQTSDASYAAVKRGYSTEGDQLLDYIEHGIFDALEKHYLKSFIFVIYLVCFGTT
jgi:meiosis-specific protein HOP1